MNEKIKDSNLDFHQTIEVLNNLGNITLVYKGDRNF